VFDLCAIAVLYCVQRSVFCKRPRCCFYTRANMSSTDRIISEYFDVDSSTPGNHVILLVSVHSLRQLAEDCYVDALSTAEEDYQTQLENQVSSAEERSYNRGYADAVEEVSDKQYDEGYNQGLNDGHTEGYTEGYTEGHDKGYTAGYDKGYDHGLDEGYHAEKIY
jgi:flagellar biosynthesis/type III secretory pathway protein FliH